KEGSFMPDAVRVFVSHSSADNEFTYTLVDELKAAGADVWVDYGNITHSDYVTEINEALATCQWMVLIWSPAALASDWVIREINAGITLEHRRKLRGILAVIVAPLDEDLIPPLWSTLERHDGTRAPELARRWVLASIGLTSDTVAQPNTITVDAHAPDGPH